MQLDSDTQLVPIPGAHTPRLCGLRLRVCAHGGFLRKCSVDFLFKSMGRGKQLDFDKGCVRGIRFQFCRVDLLSISLFRSQGLLFIYFASVPSEFCRENPRRELSILGFSATWISKDWCAEFPFKGIHRRTQNRSCEPTLSRTSKLIHNRNSAPGAYSYVEYKKGKSKHFVHRLINYGGNNNNNIIINPVLSCVLRRINTLKLFQ